VRCDDDVCMFIAFANNANTNKLHHSLPLPPPPPPPLLSPPPPNTTNQQQPTTTEKKKEFLLEIIRIEERDEMR